MLFDVLERLGNHGPLQLALGALRQPLSPVGVLDGAALQLCARCRRPLLLPGRPAGRDGGDRSVAGAPRASDHEWQEQGRIWALEGLQGRVQDVLVLRRPHRLPQHRLLKRRAWFGLWAIVVCRIFCEMEHVNCLMSTDRESQNFLGALMSADML